VVLSGNCIVIGAPQLLGRSFYVPNAINTNGQSYGFIRDLSPPAYGRPSVDDIARRVRRRGLHLSALLRALFEPCDPFAFHPTNFT